MSDDEKHVPWGSYMPGRHDSAPVRPLPIVRILGYSRVFPVTWGEWALSPTAPPQPLTAPEASQDQDEADASAVGALAIKADEIVPTTEEPLPTSVTNSGTEVGTPG